MYRAGDSALHGDTSARSAVSSRRSALAGPSVRHATFPSGSVSSAATVMPSQAPAMVAATLRLPEPLVWS